MRLDLKIPAFICDIFCVFFIETSNIYYIVQNYNHSDVKLYKIKDKSRKLVDI